ncbi:MAG: branched-chain amino acid ABC transporter ATP-binding protein/permease [Oscillospiraceae bacterium]|nr:branched-chain amino acid ABC transporter ATP-binding protein/permease [Oscillospiraceae bacterium]
MSNYQLSLIMLSCISIITVCGVFAMTSLAGMFSLGQAAYMSICAYVTFVLAKMFNIPILVTAIFGVLFSALIAWIISIPTLKLRRDYFALLSVGFSQMVAAVVILLGDYTNASIGFSKIPKTKGLVYIVAGTAALIVFMVRNLKYSRFGRMCMALKTDEIAARSFGIDVYKLKIKVYVLASAIAAVGGIMYGLRNRIITPDAFGWSLSAEMQIFLFFGGTNSLTGSVISAAVLKLLPELLRDVSVAGVSLQEFRTVLYCVLIIIVINFRTQGILGEKELSFAGLFGKKKAPAVPAAPAEAPDAAPARHRVRVAPAADAKTVLSTSGVRMAFGGVVAVDDFSMELREGEIRGIIGPNGAGKTTIYNVLSRIYTQDQGSIDFLGENIDKQTQIRVARMGLSRTFQNTRLFTGLSVLDNVKVALDFDGRYNIFEAMFLLPRRFKQEKQTRARAMECLRILKLDQYAAMRPSSLPYGLQRRVEIARALANDPKVLMLDEPAAGLNPEEVFALIDFINDIKKSYPRLAILVIEHRMDLIMNLCDYIYVQDFGHTIAQGTPDEIQTDPKVLAAYLGEEDKRA